MGIGVLFLLLLIAATIAPLVWAAWWAGASVARPAPRSIARPVAEPVRNVRSGFAFPQPADLNLPRHARTIAIHRLSDGAEIATCSGPDPLGRCPRATADGTVPCAGCMLSLPRPVRGSGEWHIPAGYKACLVGSYQVFRQPAS